MGIPLLAIAAAGSALKGIAGIGQGYMQGKSLAAQAAGAKIERDMALLRGTQIQEQSRAALATTLGNIAAIRSTRGVAGDSQTGQLIERRTMADFYRDEAVARLGELNRASAAGMAAKGYRTASRWALPLSVINSAGDFAQAFSYGKQAFTKPDPIADLKGLY